jgi:hypothetical protein
LGELARELTNNIQDVLEVSLLALSEFLLDKVVLEGVQDVYQ